MAEMLSIWLLLGVAQVAAFRPLAARQQAGAGLVDCCKVLLLTHWAAIR